MNSQQRQQEHDEHSKIHDQLHASAEDINNPQMHPAAAEVPISILCYSFSSICLILLNKLVIDTYAINYPMGLLFVQNMSAVLIVVGAKAMGLISYPSFDLSVAKRWLPLTIIFVLMLWTSMRSLKIMSVAVQTILKNLAMVLIALGDRYFFGKVLTPIMFAAFVMMAVGSYVGSAGDRWVTSEGLFWTFANVFATVGYVLYMKVLLGHVSKEIGMYGPVFYNNLLSLPFLAIPSMTTLPAMFSAIGETPPAAKVCLFLMVFVASFMSFVTFWCMRVTSPTTYSVTGALNKIPLALLGVLVFDAYPTTQGWVGIAVALTGGLLYTYANLPRPQLHADAAESEKGLKHA